MSPVRTERTPSERLYALLPTIYRMRDFDQGEPLRALLALLEEELSLVEADIARLYDSWFVETCDEWAVPYLGDQIGARLKHSVSPRAFTANTLAYRRRKGTLATLTALARDVTGWPAQIVEYQSLVVTSQHLNSPRPTAQYTADLRRCDELDNIGTPFERIARTVDIRSRGRYHPGQLGLHVWRTAVVRQERSVAVAASTGCFYVSPLGQPQALWSPARSRPGLEATTELGLAPQPIGRRTLYRVLEARRQAAIDGRTLPDPYFGSEPVLRICYRDDSGLVREVPPEQLVAADLASFWRPPAKLRYRRSGDGKTVELPVTVAIDPERGRLAFAEGETPRKVWITYHYGQVAELGSGGYERTLLATESARCVSVRDGDLDGVLQSLGDATTASSLWQGSQQLVIEILDSDRYQLSQLLVPPGSTLTLRAKSGARPLLTTTTAPLSVALGAAATLQLDGLLVAGSLTVQAEAGSAPGSAATIKLHHTTLVPGVSLADTGAPKKPTAASLTGSATGTLALTVELTRCICGPIQLGPGGNLLASGSIIDSPGSLPAVLAPAASLTHTTVLGICAVIRLTDTSDCLFLGPVNTIESVEGDIAYSVLPYRPDDRVSYRCQPHLSLEEPDAAIARVLAELRPQLVSRRYGTPGYAQLDARSASALRSAARDQGEPGAFHHLQQALRESNLIDSQAEYLRSSLTLNLFVVT